MLLRAVRRHTDCPWVLLYIDRWLKAPVQVEDGSVVPRTAGTPQGGVVSPLLANLFLHYAFDMWMARTYPHIPFERYADDIICHCEKSTKRRGRYGARLLIALRSASWCCIRRRQKTVYCKDANRRGDFPSQSFDFLGLIPSEEDAMARTHPHARFPAAARPQALTSHQPGDPGRWALHHHSDKSPPEYWLDGVILLAFIIAIPANEIVMPTALMLYMNQSRMVSLEGSVLAASSPTTVGRC